jgi:regulator of protease activity HflC (stomatin/prohibitin superfamily)
MIEYIIGVVILLFLAPTMLFINQEWEKSIVFTLGKFSRIVGAGLNFKLPFIENIRRVDVRLMTMDMQKQEVITKDNISVYVDAVVFYKVIDVKKAVLEVGDYLRNIEQQSLGSLRDVVGEKELDELLSQKESIAKSIKDIVDSKVDAWGVDIDQIKLQNIELPADMKRVMARQAEAEREKRAVIISAEGELEASKKLKLAADELSKSNGAMQLRVLSTISDVSQDQSNTIVFALPWEVMTGKGPELTAAAMKRQIVYPSKGEKQE